MQPKNFELKLTITAEQVLLTGQGVTVVHNKNHLPGWLHDIATTCLQSDEELCRDLAEGLKRKDTGSANH